MTCFEMKERGKNRKDIIKGELSLLDVQAHQSCCEISASSPNLMGGWNICGKSEF